MDTYEFQQEVRIDGGDVDGWPLSFREFQGYQDYKMGWPQTPPKGIPTSHVQAWMRGWVRGHEEDRK